MTSPSEEAAGDAATTPENREVGALPRGHRSFDHQSPCTVSLYFSGTENGHGGGGKGLGSDTPEGHMLVTAPPPAGISDIPQEVLTPGQNDKLVKFNNSDIFISKRTRDRCPPLEDKAPIGVPCWALLSPSFPQYIHVI